MDPTANIVSHTAELCANIIPSMKNNLIKNITSTVKIGDYNICITITKESVLGKRPYSVREEQEQEYINYPKYEPDSRLYNTYGHNFTFYS